MRMIIVNVFNTLNTLRMSREMGAKKYFCVSTDKAANPVNMMGASKRIMEMFLMRESLTQDISMARFANVAFSDGSLLHGFNQRFLKRQPFSERNRITENINKRLKINFIRFKNCTPPKLNIILKAALNK